MNKKPNLRDLFIKINEEGEPVVSFYRYNKETDSFESCNIKDLEANDVFIRVDVTKNNNFIFIAADRASIDTDGKWVIPCVKSFNLKNTF